METSSGIPHRIGSDEENSGLPFLLNRERDEQLSLLAFSPSQDERFGACLCLGCLVGA